MKTGVDLPSSGTIDVPKPSLDLIKAKVTSTGDLIVANSTMWKGHGESQRPPEISPQLWKNASPKSRLQTISDVKNQYDKLLMLITKDWETFTSPSSTEAEKSKLSIAFFHVYPQLKSMTTPATGAGGPLPPPAVAPASSSY
jgi:hypothetical protein